MVNKIFRRTQFASLFPVINYDSEQVAESSLDIWSNLFVYAIPIGFDEELVGEYKVQKYDTLEGIAAKLYNSVHYWWLVPLANNAEDPFDFLDNAIQEDNNIKVFKPEFLSQVTSEVKRIVNQQNVEYFNRTKR